MIYIEVPCFDWILRARALGGICYECVNYFRLGDFSRMFGRVVEGGHLFGGEYLYVVADLATLRPPVSSPADRVDFPEDFLASDLVGDRVPYGARRRKVSSMRCCGNAAAIR